MKDEVKTENKVTERPKIILQTLHFQTVSAAESAAAFNGCAFLCDVCDAYLSPSNGGRFKCMICDNYDLCANCLAKVRIAKVRYRGEIGDGISQN